jgi:DNA replication protein DnaC
MEPLDFSRSTSLNNVPKKKLLEALSVVENSNLSLQDKHTKLVAINRYAESNIPVEYWKKIELKNVQLLASIELYASDFKKSYIEGKSICLAGGHGVGKTTAITTILKLASHKGYSCLYTTLSDIVSALTQNNDDKFNCKKELSMVDFLAIDEVDQRFFNQSEFSSDLFARSFELIIRNRIHNKLPIILATNSPNIKESFQSYFKESLDSLLNNISFVFILDKDFRNLK